MIRNAEKGQAYIETIFVVPLFVIFLIAMAFSSRVYITKIKLENAARHGVFLIAYARYNETQVRSEIVDYLRPRGVVIESTSLKQITLDDVFLHLTGKELRE